MRKVVLWIEDGAFNELTMLATPVYLSGEYELAFAFSATEALQQLERREFDAVVVDIRIPPGDDSRWVNAHYEAGSQNSASRLGLRLLEVVLGGDSEWTRHLQPGARDRTRYGVLSVESGRELQADLERLGITCYRDKGNGRGPDALLHAIESILAQRYAPSGGDIDGHR